MTNKDFFDSINNKTCAYIETMFYLPASIDSSELNDFLESDFDDELLEKLFPDVDVEEWNQSIEERDKLSGHLIYSGYYGFLAEVRVPYRDSFRFKDGTDEYSSCGVYPGITRSEFIYFESIDDLPARLKEIDAMVLKEDIEAFKKRKE